MRPDLGLVFVYRNHCAPVAPTAKATPRLDVSEQQGPTRAAIPIQIGLCCRDRHGRAPREGGSWESRTTSVLMAILSARGQHRDKLFERGDKICRIEVRGTHPSDYNTSLSSGQASF